MNLTTKSQGVISIDGDSKYLGGRSFWRLDEDPSAQGFDKAGFWIWGLFEEPKYPFMLLQLELTQAVPVANGEIPAGIIYGQVLSTSFVQSILFLAMHLNIWQICEAARILKNCIKSTLLVQTSSASTLLK